MDKAVVIFSGGQDSTVALAEAISVYGKDNVFPIKFDYGQTHRIELTQAEIIAARLGVYTYNADIKILNQLSSSALTRPNFNRESKLPLSFTANRNALFITLAHAYAQNIGASVIYAGMCQTDYSGFPDCREEFLRSLIKLLNIGSGENCAIAIELPIINLTKAETFKLGEQLGIMDIIINDTHTCYNGDRTPNEWGAGCGECPACKLRKEGYAEYRAKC